MRVCRAGEAGGRRGAEERFTGAVWLHELLRVPAPNGVSAFLVYFEPGARTAWHSHPEGQVLYVVSGKGRIKKSDTSGEEEFEISPGDLIYCPPNERHWHGAEGHAAMVHLAVNLVNSGKETWWGEKVRDERSSA